MIETPDMELHRSEIHLFCYLFSLLEEETSYSFSFLFLRDDYIFDEEPISFSENREIIIGMTYLEYCISNDGVVILCYIDKRVFILKSLMVELFGV